MMLFSENINLFNQGSRTFQTDRHDYYCNTALCTKVRRAVIQRNSSGDEIANVNFFTTTSYI